jgi:hypothetical protein
MNSETGFLKIFQDMDSGGAKAGSPKGRAKSIAGPLSGTSRERETLSSLLTSGRDSQGGIPAASTAIAAFQSSEPARLSLYIS